MIRAEGPKGYWRAGEKTFRERLSPDLGRCYSANSQKATNQTAEQDGCTGGRSVAEERARQVFCLARKARRAGEKTFRERLSPGMGRCYIANSQKATNQPGGAPDTGHEKTFLAK